ncbi:hypothetical protein EZH24_13700 [Brachyspira catarrhinii]|uniref:Uncharacterized protein n=1 Tax=Brachyspira catarrhinii TaxID=2528966 RepID=A0ABY2TPK6_9SPIR|nr:hypothetical protein EZH24_13700 [Brachyspira catarrhinii]
MLVLIKLSHYEDLKKSEIIQFMWIATPHFTKGGQTPVRLAMTNIRNKVAHAVRHMSMTITKIFNSISFRDYSLLFIKN